MAFLHIIRYILLSCLALRGTDRKNAPPADLSPECSTGEVYSACRGHCQRTCCNREVPFPCSTDVCVPACVCAEGLVRGPDGACVPESACADRTTEAPSTRRCCDFIVCHNSCVVMRNGEERGRCINGECVCYANED